MKKKLFHGIIAAVIFIALVIGVNLSTGFTAIVAVIALVLHSVQTVWLFGRKWKTEEEEAPERTWTKPTYDKPTYDKPKGEEIKE